MPGRAAQVLFRLCERTFYHQYIPLLCRFSAWPEGIFSRGIAAKELSMR